MRSLGEGYMLADPQAWCKCFFWPLSPFWTIGLRVVASWLPTASFVQLHLSSHSGLRRNTTVQDRESSKWRRPEASPRAHVLRTGVLLFRELGPTGLRTRIFTTCAHTVGPGATSAEIRRKQLLTGELVQCSGRRRLDSLQNDLTAGPKFFLTKILLDCSPSSVQTSKQVGSSEENMKSALGVQLCISISTVALAGDICVFRNAQPWLR